MGNPMALRAIRQNFRTADPAVPAAFKAESWGRIPRTYIRLTADRAHPVALQDRFVAEVDALTPENPFDVHSLELNHVDVLIRPTPVTNILADAGDLL